MDIFTLTIAISIAIFVIIGSVVGRSVKHLDDYFVAGRRAPTLLIVGTLVASVFSSTIFLGEAGFTYSGQMGPYLLLPAVACTGYIYGGLLFGRYLRRSRAPTVADFFGQRFNSQRVQQVSGLTIIVALGGYLLVVTQGAALLLSDLTALSFNQSLLIAWLSYTLFTMYSGSQGVILTDTLMFLLFVFATVFFIGFIVNDLGGIATAVESLSQLQSKPGIASWHGVIGPGTDWPTAMDFLIWVLIIDIAWSLVYAVSPWQASRHLMAKNEHVVIRASVYAALAVILLQIMIYGAGGLINLANPSIEPVESAMIWAAKNMVPEFLGALLLAGIMAAALSSASTFLSLVGFSASNDIIKHSETSEALSLRFTRIVMLAIGIIVLLASLYFPPNIFWLMMFIGTLFASSWGPVALMSVWSKNISESAAFWGMAAGFVFNVLPAGLQTFGFITLPSYLDPALIGGVMSLATVMIISKLTKVSRAEAVYRMRLHRTPVQELDLKAVKTSLLAPAILILYGCVMPFIMSKFYVVPYQTGSGELLADGSINWFTGEALLSLSWAAVYIPLGLITAKVIRSSYSPSAKIKNTQY
ncbi:sodium:solute symporter family protein [Dasania sp. GY-MA-18]|uniref:Sodium:solute symporter family protein n=1 Tax=Dasania phycosphaerae TaxID=2950436 RepID=A0A9J6RJB6_9GAMM|nr:MULTISPECIES: sodium:solute symporter family protein [Dasania]MCR8922080.1 sodium:solute symporter family protein [Dasania sp. GY-MA-18]MCZ0864508.1 sodium:solute symporter family protein [Dasania phycosphaerae]MCZ0868236.1 sodium:solute symporter family protein [Dasania phycosphaerae]